MFNTYEIYKMWLHKYENGVTHNKEHIFTLELSEKENICINPDEHDEYIWLPRVKAAEKVFSHTNREAIFNHIQGELIMAGHSKWANIQHRKKRQDAKRGKLFTRLIREITVAAREGGGDQDSNPRLRLSLIHI